MNGLHDRFCCAAHTVTAHVARCLCHGLATFAATLAFGTAAAADGSLWAAQDGGALSDMATSAAQTAGWACTGSAALPGAGRSLLACRKAKGGSGELQLLEMTAGAGAAARLRVLGGLGDASTAHSRVFTPPRPCPTGAGAACLAALVLVDHRDESSCYGTLVYAAVGSQALRRLGTLNEVLRTPGAESETCVAVAAAVSSEAVSSRSAAVRITLQGPLWRIGRDGVSRALRSSTVVYRARTQPLSLKRSG